MRYCAAGLLFLLLVVSTARAEDPLFTFWQLSDAHIGDEENRPVHTRLADTVALANTLSPDFLINTGDMTTHPVYDASPENLAEYDEYLSYIDELEIPIYHLPGNHDIGYFDPGDDTHHGGLPWGDYNDLTAAYVDKLGPLEQSFTHHGVRFILMNNNPPASGHPGYLSQTQLDWIENELVAGKPTFIFGHIQVLENGTGSPWGASAESLVNLCEQHNVAAVAYGHQHQTIVTDRNDIRYIMCPSLRNDGQQDIFEYRVFQETFELWSIDVVSQDRSLLGTYSLPSPAPEPGVTVLLTGLAALMGKRVSRRHAR